MGTGEEEEPEEGARRRSGLMPLGDDPRLNCFSFSTSISLDLMLKWAKGGRFSRYKPFEAELLTVNGLELHTLLVDVLRQMKILVLQVIN